MKKIVIGIIAIVSLCSCIRETSTLVTYYYENKSGVDVKILDLGREKEIISIDNELIYKRVEGADTGHFPFPFNRAWSIEVIFNGEKSIKYASTYMRASTDDNVENNPLSLDSYRVVTIKKKKHESEYAYYYTFTEKQYQDAEPYVPEK